jgi:hypothetical protein
MKERSYSISLTCRRNPTSFHLPSEQILLHYTYLPVLHSPVCTSSAIHNTLYLVHNSRTFLRYPSCGTTTPASPWMGSTMKAQQLGSCNSFYNKKSSHILREVTPLLQIFKCQSTSIFVLTSKASRSSYGTIV